MDRKGICEAGRGEVCHAERSEASRLRPRETLRNEFSVAQTVQTIRLY
jgi:hypothetical protein